MLILSLAFSQRWQSHAFGRSLRDEFHLCVKNIFSPACASLAAGRLSSQRTAEFATNCFLCVRCASCLRADALRQAGVASFARDSFSRDTRNDLFYLRSLIERGRLSLMNTYQRCHEPFRDTLLAKEKNRANPLPI